MYSHFSNAVFPASTNSTSLIYTFLLRHFCKTLHCFCLSHKFWPEIRSYKQMSRIKSCPTTPIFLYGLFFTRISFEGRVDISNIIAIWSIFYRQKSLKEYMRYVYFKPYCRIQVYLVGFLLGYIMYRYRNTKARTPNWVSTGHKGQNSKVLMYAY